MSNDEKIAEIIADFFNALEAAAVNAKRQLAESIGVAEAVKEETFTSLKFEAQKGERLGEFEVAAKANNLPDKWQQAYNILRRNNATIKERYHGAGYAYSYWVYGEDRIYRQKLKKQDAST